MPQHCVEVVVYKVKNPHTAEAARRAIRPHIETFPGFLGWQAVTSADDPRLFTDIVTWASLPQAREASQLVMEDPLCASFFAEIDEIVSFGHYA